MEKSSVKYNTKDMNTKKALQTILKNASNDLPRESTNFKIPDLSNLQSLLTQIIKDVNPQG